MPLCRKTIRVLEKAFGSDINLSTREWGVDEFEPIYLDQPFFHSTFRLSFQFRSFPQPFGPGDYCVRSLIIDFPDMVVSFFEINHSVLFARSSRRTSRQTASRCSLIERDYILLAIVIRRSEKVDRFYLPCLTR